MHLYGEAKRLQFAYDTDHAGVARIRNILLESQAEYGDNTSPALSTQQPSDTFARDAVTHAIVDPATGQDDFGVVARLFCTIGQVIGVNANAVPADQARLKWHEIPFGTRGCQHIAGVDIERPENQRTFVHERDVEIALCVFDDLGGLCDPDRGRAVSARCDHRSINVSHDIEGFGIL